MSQRTQARHVQPGALVLTAWGEHCRVARTYQEHPGRGKRGHAFVLVWTDDTATGYEPTELLEVIEP